MKLIIRSCRENGSNHSVEYKQKDTRVWTITNDGEVKQEYTYDEAVNLTGYGPYSLLLLLATSMSLVGASTDLFGFAYVTSAAACDLKINATTNKLMLSLPFIGAILMAYPWGYITDMYGRNFALLVSMSCSFILSCLAAFSPNWIVLLVLKCFSVSLSSFAQSGAYTFMGEVCATKVKNYYFNILTIFLLISIPFQMAVHYGTVNFDLSINLGLINFVPWRVLELALALPLGISTISLLFLYESPKYLANMGKKDQALEVLGKMWIRNRQRGNEYPVKRLILHEESTYKVNEVTLLQSFWEQTAPLFKMPLLVRTLQLLFISAMIYSVAGSILIWLPFIVNEFIRGATSTANDTEGLCNMISRAQTINTTEDFQISCIAKSDVAVIYSSLGQAVTLSILTVAISVVPNRRRLILVLVLAFAALCAAASASVASNVASIIMFMGIYTCSVAFGILSFYFVDLFPTSYRGMISCLGVLMARVSNIMAVNIVGAFIMNNCANTFYVFSVCLFGGVLASCFLPPDRRDKS